jgi:hypothetical protein
MGAIRHPPSHGSTIALVEVMHVGCAQPPHVTIIKTYKEGRHPRARRDDEARDRASAAVASAEVRVWDK